MAKKPATKTVLKEPFDDEKYMKWVVAPEAGILMAQIESIMTRAKTPFDGMCTSLRLLDITPSFKVISALLIIVNHTRKFLAKEEKQRRKQLRKIGVRSGRVVLVP